MITKDFIQQCISKVDGISLINTVTTNENIFLFKIRIDAGVKGSLDWEVEISSLYPLKYFGHETIIFRNNKLIEYPHIMEGGILCMHNSIQENTENQLISDLQLLKQWVEDYYIKGIKDQHYEHLVVNHDVIKGVFNYYCFTETVSEFENNDFGLISYTPLMIGQKNGKYVNNFLIQRFISMMRNNKNSNYCNISSFYKHLPYYEGIYCILKGAPSVYNKFIINDYQTIDNLFTQEQKKFIYTIANKLFGRYNSFPLLCGYRIQDGDMHWQAINLFRDNFPIELCHLNDESDKQWHTKFKSGKIEWAQTDNISYKYFFGRGAMPIELARKRILILGIGAIGSIIAETLTRCGAKYITLYDYDDKEPCNICRSAYSFISGVTKKAIELESILCQISPHLECFSLSPDFDLIKSLADNNNTNSDVIEFLNKHDIILDCTTDNQLMHLLDTSNISSIVVNVSITNNAQDLVCVFSPNVVEKVNFIFRLLNRNTDTDLYNPTGCWSPTFRASYNDISCVVQLAISHIIKMLCRKEHQTSFYITNDNNIQINRI